MSCIFPNDYSNEIIHFSITKYQFLRFIYDKIIEETAFVVGVERSACVSAIDQRS